MFRLTRVPAWVGPQPGLAQGNGEGDPQVSTGTSTFPVCFGFASYGIKLLTNSLMWSLIQQTPVRCFEAETVHQPHRLCPLYLEGSGLRWGSRPKHRVWGGDTPITARRQPGPGKLLSLPPDTRWLLMLGNYCFNH